MTKSSRRVFLVRSTVGVAAAGTGAALWLQGCGGKKAEALKCNDTSGLDAAAVQTRKSLAYVEKSAKGNDNCASCRFYESKGDKQCGGCTLIQGPINPAGYCNSWAQMEG